MHRRIVMLEACDIPVRANARDLVIAMIHFFLPIKQLLNTVCKIMELQLVDKRRKRKRRL